LNDRRDKVLKTIFQPAVKKPHQASNNNSAPDGKTNKPNIEKSEFSPVKENSMGKDPDQIPLFPNRAAFLKQLEKSQEAYVDALEEIREQSGSVMITDLAVKRKSAMSAIRSISTLAKAGDVYALSALYSIAELAVVELGQQSIEDRKTIAGDQIGWPLMLSHSEAWNKKHMDECLYNLQLGKNVTKLVNLDALGVKSSHLKELIARLVALIAGWKEEEVDQSVLDLPDEKIADVLEDAAAEGKVTAKSISEAREKHAPKNPSPPKARKVAAIKIETAVKAAEMWSNFLVGCVVAGLSNEQKKLLLGAIKKAEAATKNLKIAA